MAPSICNRRTVQCSAESAAASELEHLQKQVFCAKVIGKARKGAQGGKALHPGYRLLAGALARAQRRPLHQPVPQPRRGLARLQASM